MSSFGCFPVHPDYIDTFERVTVVEKREGRSSNSSGVAPVVHGCRRSSGQFLSVSPANRQYCLDLKKTDDFDTLIVQVMTPRAPLAAAGNERQSAPARGD